MTFVRAYALQAGIAALLILLLVVQWALHRAEKAELRAEAARAREAVATVQGGLNQTAGEAVSQAQTREITIIRQSEERADAVAAAPGGSDPLPPGVLDSWRAAMGELRTP